MVLLLTAEMFPCIMFQFAEQIVHYEHLGRHAEIQGIRDDNGKCYKLTGEKDARVGKDLF